MGALNTAEQKEYLALIKKQEISTDKLITTLSGGDLEIGGKFHKDLYDKKIKRYADKFGKKFGAKVGVIDVERGRGMKIRRRGVDSPLEQETITEKVWTLPVNKKMRESVLKKGVTTFGVAGVAAGAANQDNQQAEMPGI